MRESARERMIFQRIAPHLTSYIPFLIPTVDGNVMKGRHALQVGMLLYEMLCGGLNRLVADPLKKVPRGIFLGREEVLRQFPLLEGLQGLNGAQVLYESHMANSERMTLAFIKTAVGNGTCAANHVFVSGFLQEGKRVAGVARRDILTGQEFEIQGKIVANATGPFISSMNSTIEGLKLRKQTTGFSKGIHMVTRQIHGRYALAISSGKKTEGYVSRGGAISSLSPGGIAVAGKGNRLPPRCGEHPVVPQEGPFLHLRGLSQVGKILHYMACGLPVACFDLANNRDFLGQAGYYAERVLRKDWPRRSEMPSINRRSRSKTEKKGSNRYEWNIRSLLPVIG